MSMEQYVNGFGVEDGQNLVETMRGYAGKHNFRDLGNGRFSINVNGYKIDTFNFSGRINLINVPGRHQPAADLLIFSPSGSAAFIRDGFLGGALQWERKFREGDSAA